MVKKNLTLKPCSFPADFCLENYQIFKGNPTSVLHDGDRIDLGNRTLQVIHTPGHSPGHCCFYEQDRGWLYSGDLIYQGCLDAFYPTTDPLAFMHSAQKVKSLNLQRIFPAHHSLDIPASLACEIADAFTSLHRLGKLQQGNGYLISENFRYIFKSINCANPLAFLSKIAYNLSWNIIAIIYSYRASVTNADNKMD